MFVISTVIAFLLLAFALSPISLMLRYSEGIDADTIVAFTAACLIVIAIIVKIWCAVKAFGSKEKTEAKIARKEQKQMNKENLKQQKLELKQQKQQDKLQKKLQRKEFKKQQKELKEQNRLKKQQELLAQRKQKQDEKQQKQQEDQKMKEALALAKQTKKEEAAQMKQQKKEMFVATSSKKLAFLLDHSRFKLGVLYFSFMIAISLSYSIATLVNNGFTALNFILASLLTIVSVVLLIVLIVNKNNYKTTILLTKAYPIIQIALIFFVNYVTSILSFLSSFQSITYNQTFSIISYFFSFAYYLLLASIVLHILIYFKKKTKLQKAYNFLYPICFNMMMISMLVVTPIFTKQTPWGITLLSLPVYVMVVFGFLLQNKIIYNEVTETEQSLYQEFQLKKESSEEKNPDEMGEYEKLNYQLQKALKEQNYLLANDLKQKIEEYKKAHPAQVKSYFDGYLIQAVWRKIKCALVNFFTFYLLYPVTVCWKLKWKAKHTVYDGKRLVFDGNGLQLLGKWILWLFLSVITIGIYGFFVGIRLEKWKASHTHLIDDIK